MKSPGRIFLFIGFIGISTFGTLFADSKAVYDCNYTSNPIKIDGNINESSWKNAKVLNFVKAGTATNAESKTEGRILWDENNIYVSFKAYDLDVWGYATGRDSISGDKLEFFFNSNPAEKTLFAFLKSMQLMKSWMFLPIYP